MVCGGQHVPMDASAPALQLRGFPSEGHAAGGMFAQHLQQVTAPRLRSCWGCWAPDPSRRTAPSLLRSDDTKRPNCSVSLGSWLSVGARRQNLLKRTSGLTSVMSGHGSKVGLSSKLRHCLKYEPAFKPLQAHPAFF